jgi:mannose-1-phosphate guanylyltransferase
MFDHTYAVIMAGGGGTRLWPVSRQSRPKQMIRLLGDKTLFQNTVERLEGLFPPERIYVVTVAEQAIQLQAQSPEIPVENYLLEPAPRGTASVIGFAATVLQQRDPQAVMVALTSDHYIRNRDLFHHLIRVAVDVAHGDYLVTLGISPTFPATGYGYIQSGDALPEKFAYPVYRVRRFKEKPDDATAREMLRSGDHSWNSGMFVWKTARILEEFEHQMPGLKSALDKIGSARGTPAQEDVMQSIWPGLIIQTIDYGVMEKAERVAVLPAGGLGWSDVGSWDSLFEVLIPDSDGNIVFSGQHIPVETHDSLVYGNGGARLVVTIGVDDLVIVDTGDVLLVCHKSQTQKVRQVVGKLKDTGQDTYL